MKITFDFDSDLALAHDVLSFISSRSAAPAEPSPEGGADADSQASEVWDTEAVARNMGLTVAAIAYGLKCGLYPKPFTRPRQARKWLAKDWREWALQNRLGKVRYQRMKIEEAAKEAQG